jgi:dolichol-phosphate mannosyltransferase
VAGAGASQPRGAEAIVLVPTYNESESLPTILARIRAAVPDADILVIDDASPDGTGELADRLAATDPHIGVLHRAGKEGLGPAYRAGFQAALERGYRYLVQMDADGSHPPGTLPAMLAVASSDQGADLVIGSRWVPGGSTVNWPRRRELLSRAANGYAGWILRVRVADVTAGYRVYRAEAMRELDLDSIRSQGYYFQVEMTVRILDAGGSVAEVPIVFAEREAGSSKMTFGIIAEAMIKVTLLGLRRLGRRRPQPREHLSVTRS